MSPQFYTYNTKKQANILMHELVHSRITIFNKKVEMFKDEEEVGNEEDKVKVVTIAQSCPIYPIKPYAGLHPHVSLDNISPLFNFGLDKTLEDA